MPVQSEVYEALSQMFLTSAEAFAFKNNLPWLTNETKHLVRDLEKSLGPKDGTANATVSQKAEDAIPQSVLDMITRFQKEERHNSATFAYWDSFLESGNILLRLLRADRRTRFLMHIQAVMETVPYFVLAGRINLGTSRSNKDRKDVKDMKEYLYSQCQDPFDLDDVPDHLMNITTGQIASREVEDSMKGIPERGKVVFDDFVKQRLGDEPTKGF